MLACLLRALCRCSPKKGGSAKKTTQKWKLYDISGGKAEKKRKSCPKCGEGVYLAEHKDRASCGKCGYTEFKKQAKAEKQETKPEKTE